MDIGELRKQQEAAENGKKDKKAKGGPKSDSDDGYEDDFN